MTRPSSGGRPVQNSDGHRRDIVRLLRENASRSDLYTVWRDFVEMAALAISNSVDRAQFTVREARYMAIIKRYTPEQARRFAEILAALTMAMETAEFDDVLGRTFMELELGNKWAGQFFTPYVVCQLMAKMNATGVSEVINKRGFVTVNDPAVGAGALPIAMAEALKHEGHNYQQCMHLTAQDVDARAVHMAYVQLSLLHVPAVVILGNSLALECREQWFTPAHILGGWRHRLARAEPTRAEGKAPAPMPAAPITRKEADGQWLLTEMFD